ncbi:MAG: nucleotidyltransferase [Nitrospirae bacterium CG08_land_8_20_14_0_20_52_24]|nr:MAG: nucleotidyltransferase [Nitrospirae bacterium CG08_land_8_20_14_0_20_52_24]PIV84939.1 MAG: nucleotidyltransferase [Nitrospirae bacterium CG17_big_fil_post_rev_8_21_14_2_50_50_9]PIX85303.1 MAG: nucleotidyltransferase [Nitrospirae bacterium CG_4_10_14_3_um_filter_53_41]
MKSVEKIRTMIRMNQDVLAQRYGVRVVGLFGSYVRGEQRRRSDIDLLVDILRPVSLLELVGAELYLSEVLGVKVDLIPKRDVREELRETIFRETVAI